MIELFDTQRLTVRRDHSLALMGSTLLLVVGLMGAYTLWLQLQVSDTLARTQSMQSQLARQSPKAVVNSAAAPKAALVADLRRQAEQLEREIAMASGDAVAMADTQQLSPAQWLQQLAMLAQNQTSLSRIDIDRVGGALLEGQATSPQALNSLVQAWEQTETLAHLRLRTLEVKQDKLAADFLRFQLHASPATRAATGAPGPVPH